MLTLVSVVVMTASVKGVSETEDVPTLYVRDVPDDLHRRLKVAAAQRGVSLRALVLAAVEREVERIEHEVGTARPRRAAAERKGKRR
jgi:plasmid stability protein